MLVLISFFFFISSKMMAQITTSKVNSNDETFATGSYNGFKILIRDNDGYVNATKLLHQINQKEIKKNSSDHSLKELILVRLRTNYR
jgi:hypothetical protein